MKKELLLRAIIDEVLYEYSSVDISDLMQDLGDDKGGFCDRFELGNWVYDLFDLADMELSDILQELYEIRKRNEEEDNEEYRLMLADLMKAQGNLE